MVVLVEQADGSRSSAKMPMNSGFRCEEKASAGNFHVSDDLLGSQACLPKMNRMCCARIRLYLSGGSAGTHASTVRRNQKRTASSIGHRYPLSTRLISPDLSWQMCPETLYLGMFRFIKASGDALKRRLNDLTFDIFVIVFKDFFGVADFLHLGHPPRLVTTNSDSDHIRLG